MLDLCHPKTSYVEVLTPGMAVFGEDRSFKNVIKCK